MKEKAYLVAGALVVAGLMAWAGSYYNETKAYDSAHDVDHAVVDVLVDHAKDHIKAAQESTDVSEQAKAAKARTASDWVREDLRGLHAIISIENQRIQAAQQQRAQQAKTATPAAPAPAAPAP